MFVMSSALGLIVHIIQKPGYEYFRLLKSVHVSGSELPPPMCVHRCKMRGLSPRKLSSRITTQKNVKLPDLKEKFSEEPAWFIGRFSPYPRSHCTRRQPALNCSKTRFTPQMLARPNKLQGAMGNRGHHDMQDQLDVGVKRKVASGAIRAWNSFMKSSREVQQNFKTLFW